MSGMPVSQKSLSLDGRGRGPARQGWEGEGDLAISAASGLSLPPTQPSPIEGEGFQLPS